MKIKNIIIKQELKRIESIQDYYEKVKELCILNGLVAFYAHTKDNTQESLKKCEKLARDTLELAVKKNNL